MNTFRCATNKAGIAGLVSIIGFLSFGASNHPKEVPFYHTLLNVPAMHAKGITGKGVKVGVVDSGNHLRSVVSVINSREFGIAPDCDLKFVDTAGDLKGDIPRTIRGLWWCATNGCRVINMSFGYAPGLYAEDQRRQLGEALFEIKRKTGAILVGSIGNNPHNELPYCPQDVTASICIGGLDSELRPGELTDSWRKDFCTFGVDVPLYLNAAGKKGKLSGTSFASPMATALVALLLQQEPSLTQDEVYEIFKSTCRKLSPVRTREFGWGLLQACPVPKNYRRQADIDREKSKHIPLSKAEILNSECEKIDESTYAITLKDGESVTLKTVTSPKNASDPVLYWYRGNKLFELPIDSDQIVTAVTNHQSTVLVNNKPMTFPRPPFVTYVGYNSDFEPLVKLRLKFADGSK